MPRLKERPIPFQKGQRLIKSYGFNGSNLEPILGYSAKTNREKINDPRRLTLCRVIWWENVYVRREWRPKKETALP